MSRLCKNRVVILGGGHAGVSAATQLLKARRPHDNLEIAVVSDESGEVWHGLMPQIVSSLIQPQRAVVPLREILPGVALYTYKIERIDLPNRRVLLSRGGEHDQVILDFDYLVLALGSVTDLSRFPGLIEHGLQTKTMGDIFHLRNHILEMLEAASVEQDPDERRRLLTFVVVGAGFAGVEIGSHANDLVRDALRFYPGIRESEIRFVIVSSGSRILPALSEGLARRAERHLKRGGIEIRRGVSLTSATTSAAVLSNGERLDTRTIIATVGIGPNPLVSDLPIELTRGRIRCDGFCRVQGWPHVYAVGDAAAIPHPQTGESFPPTFLSAVTQGHCAADNILAEVRGRPTRRYHYESIGELAVLSKGYAVAQFKGVPLDGVLASVVGRLFFLSYVPTWRRRLLLALDLVTGAAFPRDITQLRVSRSDAIAPMRFGTGEVIVREGEQGSRFYIVTEGEVEVVRQGAFGREDLVAHLGPGAYFGEVALLNGVARTATVRARTDIRVLSIARQDFGTLVRHMPALHAAFQQAPGMVQHVQHAHAEVR